VLDPHLDAVRVNVASAADLAEREVLALLHFLVAHATHLLRVEFHAGHHRLFISFLRFFVFRRLSVISPICEAKLDYFGDFRVYIGKLPQ